ncbi:LuxR C-terminal-related transcriptional regulator [Kribbella sp. NPDC048928]|uniref:LuxR C-terminal-related transcriptional regulator n=1 Tax=Kribbella sp. NPDC048928 TaxID=3364111 RepID=UPI0037119921
MPGISRTMQAPASSSVHGRSTEQELVCELLELARRGPGGVVLVDGEPGIGKSAVLRQSVEVAAGQGFAVLTRGAEVGARIATAPVLVCIDDLHLAGAATLASLRTLPGDLAGRHVAWLLARSTAVLHGADQLFDLLEKAGGVRITLDPLPPDAVRAIIADRFGVPPNDALAELAAGAAGNPALVTELLDGLSDEQGVEVVDGHASLSLSALPQRVQRLARRRLADLTKQARQVLMTAAVIGPIFRLEDVCTMVGTTPAALLPVLEETLDAAVTTALDDAFAFRQPLLRRAICDLVPRPARAALRHQYEALLEAPAPSVPSPVQSLPVQSLPVQALPVQVLPAEDLGVLYVERGEPDQAILHFEEALQGYREAGADRDEARVRSRLRALGVRSRHWQTVQAKPITGWDSLTGTEQTVAGLVAQGLNNKQAAARLYISQHTVAHHLRRAFCKLGITSRVELTRIVIEQSA